MDLTLFPLFVLFSFWWWILFVFASFLLFMALENDSFGGATAVFLGTFVLMTVFGGSDFVNFILTGWNFVLVLLAYLVLGVIWGFIKWLLFVTKRLDEYKDLKMEWLEEQGVAETTVPDHLKEEWLSYVKKNFQQSKYRYRDDFKISDIQPKASQYKLQIINWMAYWPWSLVWTLCSDVIKRVFIKIQRWCTNLMDGISNWVFKNIHKDF